MMRISVLALAYTNAGKEDVLYPVLLQHGKEIILVDCGYEETLPQLEHALQLEGYALSQLTGLLLTHHDIDHVGAAFAIRQKNPSLIIYASPLEAPWINGQEKPLRLQQAESIAACLPESEQPSAQFFQAFLASVKPVAVDVLLEEGITWPLAEFVDIIPTPGHTPGHISLYLKEEQVLVAADAVVIEDKGLDLANPQYALDLPKAIASVEKISRLPIRKLVCYHGGTVSENVGEALAQLVEKWRSPRP
ncbi:MBL fold metallo-hydrolase [Flavisolibacter sp. BT320]|nr:MBL fold metallo-hydrolase [Flavisolibacter longurius]